MSWQVSMFFFFIASVALALQRRVYSQKTILPVRVPPALAYVIGVLPLGIIVGLIVGDLSIDWSGITVLSLFFMALFIGLFNWLVFEAAKKLNVALFQTIFQIQAVTAAALGWIFLGEGLTGLQMIGGALLLIGAVFAAQSYKLENKTKFKNSAVFIAVIASMSLGAGVFAEKVALSHVSLGAYFIVGFALQSAAICIIAYKDLRKLDFKSIPHTEWIDAVKMGVLNATIGFFFIYALNTADNVALVSLVSTFQMPLIAVAAFFILKEKEVGWKLALAIITAFIGLILTSL